jgi:hypothetical protein
MKLTSPQIGWLVALFTRQDITTYGRSGNSKPLSRLINLGLVRVVDSSYPSLTKKYLPMLTYCLTAKGIRHCNRNADGWRKAGWAV